MNTKVSNQHQQNPSSNKAIKQYAAFFDLLDQVDQRLKKEDPGYQAKYYPEENLAERTL